jgi:uncharacterized glyoxalase superfamily protein PhnB
MKLVDQIILTLHVPSIEDTAAWYQRVLGWRGHFDTFDEQDQCLFGSVALRDEPFTGFNLRRASGPTGCAHFTAWVYVEDVDQVYARVNASGWQMISAPQDQFWGERTLQLTDLNGFQLVFAEQTENVDLDEIRRRQVDLKKSSGGES